MHLFFFFFSLRFSLSILLHMCCVYLYDRTHLHMRMYIFTGFLTTYNLIAKGLQLVMLVV